MPRLLLLALLAGCATTPPGPPPDSPPVPLDLVPGGHLLKTPTEDPGALLGAFVPDGVSSAELDESSLQRTACSKLFTQRTIPLGGGESELVLAVSPEAAARWRLRSLAHRRGAEPAPMLVKVRFRAVEKRIAWAPERKLLACCDDRRDDCTGSYVGSALRGSGSIWVATQKVDGGPAAPTVRYEHGMKWERAARFDDAFFALGTPVTLRRWADEPEPD